MKKFVYALAVCLAACLSTGCSDNDDPDPVPDGEKVTLTEAGTLRTVLGDHLMEIEAITIDGPMDFLDLSALYAPSVEGKLMSIDLSDARLEDNTIHGYVFCPYVNGAASLPSVRATRPSEEKYSPTPKFTRFVFPKNLEKIGAFAFGYTRVEKLEFPATLRQIGSSAFEKCTNLKQDRLFLPEGLEKIGVGAFCDATLNDVVLPSTLKEIGAAAFDSAIAGNVYSLSPEPPVCLYDSAFDGCENSTLYVPVGTKASYAAVKGWSGFAKIVETKDFPKQR